MPNHCISCSIETTKYKCPTCFSYYCSLDCFKQHKLQPCEQPKTTENDGNHKELKDGSAKTNLPFSTDDTVNPLKLQELNNSEHLKRILDNPHLRNILKEIDSAPNAFRAINAAMMEPLFLELADECLKIVDPEHLDSLIPE